MHYLAQEELDHTILAIKAGPNQMRSIGRRKLPNKCLLLTSPDAAQSVLRPLCLLSWLAAEAHVGWAPESPARILDSRSLLHNERD